MGSAHGGGGLPATEWARQSGVEPGFLGLLVRQYPLGEKGVRASQRLQRGRIRTGNQLVGGLAQRFDGVAQFVVFGRKAPQHFLGVGREFDLDGRIATQGAQRVEDHRDVDALLQECASGGRQPAQRGNGHRQQRQRHTDHGALHGDPPRPPGDVHRVGETVQAIRGQHDVGGFGRSRRAARAHRDTDRRPQPTPGRR